MISLLYRLADAARDWRRARATTAEQAHGRRGEDLAHRFLRRQGLTIVARNYRARSSSGELDMVAWDGDRLVFVEVKTRASAEFGSPGRAMGRAKEKYLRRAAGEYLRLYRRQRLQAMPDHLPHVVRHDDDREGAGRAGRLGFWCAR